MDYLIRNIENSDFDEVFQMMKTFYNSPAVFTNGSDEIFKADINACLDKDCPFLEGFVFTLNNKILGYVMIAKSFSTEFGKSCIWIEDLYIKPQYRGNGISPEFIKFIENNYKNSIFRLEAEEENLHAVHVYKKAGFSKLPYIEMVKHN